MTVTDQSSNGNVVVKVHRDASPKAFAAVAATAAAVGAGAAAVLTHRREARIEPADGAPPPPSPTPLRSAARADQKAEDEGAAGRPSGNAIVRKIDGLQQRTPVLAFPYAVVKKFGDDSAGSLAALIAYYGFLSLFPLLLAFTTILAAVLAGHPDLQAKVLDSALAQFPVIGDQLRQNVHSLNGSGIGLAVGIAGALWGGMGVMKAAGTAMDEVWEVPKRSRPTFIRALVRAVSLLAVIGGGVVGTTALAGLGSAAGGGLVVRIAGLAAALVVDVAMFTIGFRALTVADVGFRDLIPGAAFAGVAWWILQGVGSYVVTHQLQGASQTYGTFAIVIGLLSWLYLVAQITLLAAEVNVVRHERLWPRSLSGDLTAADERAFAAYAKVEQRQTEETVDVDFDETQDETDERSAGHDAFVGAGNGLSNPEHDDRSTRREDVQP